MVTSLFSPLTTEDSMVIALGSPKIVVASSKEIPCFLRFDRALEASHSKSRLIDPDYHERDHDTLGISQELFRTAPRH
jgi:hypothetical protein